MSEQAVLIAFATVWGMGGFLLALLRQQPEVQR